MTRAAFRRDVFSRVVGCVVYVVATPFIVLFVAIWIVLPAVYGLESLGVKKDTATGIAALIAFPVVTFFVVRWAIRDYWRRAGLTVEIGYDRVVVTVDDRSRVLTFTEVKAIRIVPASSGMVCVLEPHEGPSLRLPPEAAPFSSIRGALQPTLVAHLARQIGEHLAEGQVIAVRDPSAGALVYLRGVGEVALAGLLIASIVRAPMAFLVARQGIAHMRCGVLDVDGGFLIHHDGLERCRGGSWGVTPWTELEIVQSDDLGFVVESREGTRFSASPYAHYYWPATFWLKGRLKLSEPKDTRFLE